MKRFLGAAFVAAALAVYASSTPDTASGQYIPRPTATPVSTAGRPSFDSSCALCHSAHTADMDHLLVHPAMPLPLADLDEKPPHFVHPGDMGSCQMCHGVENFAPRFERSFRHGETVHLSDLPAASPITVTVAVTVPRAASNLTVSDHFPVAFQILDAGGGLLQGGHGEEQHLDFAFGAARAGQRFTLTYSLLTPAQGAASGEPYRFRTGVGYGNGVALESPDWPVEITVKTAPTPTTTPTPAPTPAAVGTATTTATPAATLTATPTVVHGHGTGTPTPMATDPPGAVPTPGDGNQQEVSPTPTATTTPTATSLLSKS